MLDLMRDETLDTTTSVHTIMFENDGEHCINIWRPQIVSDNLIIARLTKSTSPAALRP